jgi:hypothetical protein
VAGQHGLDGQIHARGHIDAAMGEHMLCVVHTGAQAQAFAAQCPVGNAAISIDASEQADELGPTLHRVDGESVQHDRAALGNHARRRDVGAGLALLLIRHTLRHCREAENRGVDLEEPEEIMLFARAPRQGFLVLARGEHAMHALGEAADDFGPVSSAKRRDLGDDTSQC